MDAFIILLVFGPLFTRVVVGFLEHFMGLQSAPVFMCLKSNEKNEVEKS